MPTVTVIEPRIKQNTLVPLNVPMMRKAVGYARVSSDDQENSYKAQMDYFTTFISTRPDMQFVRMYSDEGVSGTGAAKRRGFEQMIRDALDGQFSLIITKSISRFARNTVTTLSTIRELKAHGVEVWFQKENIQTFDPKSELITSIMSSLAQEESRSISENVSWGIRKSFADGKVSFKYKQFLGYRRGANGKPEIDPEEAKIVRTIYRRFLEGETPYMIAKALTNQGIPTKTGKAKWSISTIRSILSNERYKGEAILQKKYTTDFLTKKQKKNEGELPQYHVTGSHPPIVSAEVWDMVQLELERRARIGARYSTESALASRLVCSDCGGFYGPKVWHSTGTNRMIVWRCNNKYKRNLTRASGQKKCASHHVIEEQVMSAFDKVVTQLLENRPEVIVACESVLNELLDTRTIDEKLLKVRSEAEEASRQVKALIDSQMREPSDSFKEKYAEIEKRYEAIQENIAVLEQEKTDRQFRAGEAEAFLNTVKDMESLSRDELFIALIDKVVVGKQFTFVLKDGIERIAAD